MRCRGECPSNALRVLNFASRASAAARQGPAGLKTAEISPPGGTPCHASGAKWPRPAVRQGQNGPQKGRALRAARAGAGRWTSLSEERGSRESGDVERQDRGRAHVTEKGSRNIRPGERSGLTARAARAPQHLLEVASPAQETLQEGT